MSASPLKILQEGQAADHTGFLVKTGGESKGARIIELHLRNTGRTVTGVSPMTGAS